MKKITKISSIIISYIANAILIIGSILLTIFLIKLQNSNNDLNEGLGNVITLIITLGVFVIGIVIKLLVLPLTIKSFLEVLPNKQKSNTKWMILHIVDYAIAISTLIYLLVVIIIK